jgi:hypothetical protein
MSWINGLLVGAGEGLRRGSETYFAARDRKRQQELQESELVDRRMAAVQRGMLDRDELDERKRSNRAQEALEHERGVSSSMDRMLSRENARYTSDESSRRAIETALIRAEQARAIQSQRSATTERIAGMPARTSVRPPRQRPTPNAQDGQPPPNFDDPGDGLSPTQRDGIMWLNEQVTDPREKSSREKAWQQARTAFPDAHPGDVAAAAKRYLDRIKRDQENRYR